MNFEWVTLPSVAGGELDIDHPDAAALLEEKEITAWIEAGAPPIEQWDRAEWKVRPPGADDARAESEASGGGFPKTPAKTSPPPVALVVSQQDAASLLGIHPDTFRKQVLPHIKVVNLSGNIKRFRVTELERFVTEREGFALRSER